MVLAVLARRRRSGLLRLRARLPRRAQARRRVRHALLAVLQPRGGKRQRGLQGLHQEAEPRPERHPPEVALRVAGLQQARQQPVRGSQPRAGDVPVHLVLPVAPGPKVLRLRQRRQLLHPVVELQAQGRLLHHRQRLPRPVKLWNVHPLRGVGNKNSGGSASSETGLPLPPPPFPYPTYTQSSFHL